MSTTTHRRLYAKYQAYQSIIFDAVLCITILGISPALKNFLMREVISNPNDIHHYSAAVGWLYVSCVIAQCLGAVLVYRRVQLQLAGDRPPYKFFLVIFLVIMHFIIFGVLLWMDGVKYIRGGEFTAWAFPGMVLPTIIAVVVVIPGKVQQRNVTTFDVIKDLVGVVLLVMSSVVVLMLFWNLTLEGLGKNMFENIAASNWSWRSVIGVKLILTLLFGVIFLLFYAPARFVLLSTCWHTRQAWIGMGVVFLPFLINLWAGG